MSQFCPQCGTKNLNEANFCKNCGFNIFEALGKLKKEQDKQLEENLKSSNAAVDSSKDQRKKIMESQKQFDISKEDSWLTAFNVLAISMAIVITIVFIVEQLTNEAPFFIIEQLTNEAASKDSTTIAEDVTIEEQKQLDQENAAREAKWNANLQEERERVSSIPSKEIIGSSNTMDSEQCEQKLNGHWLWDGNNNRWICHIKSK